MKPLDRLVDYTLNHDQAYSGTVEHQKVGWIVDPDFASLVIRYHPNLETAGSYLTSISDLSGSEAVDPVWSTDAGFFTLARRSTDQSWPGPMIIYVKIYQY